MTSRSPNPDVLFLCTANFFRSRYAHLYFNFLAQRSIGLQADSRGLMAYRLGLQGISRYALDALKAKGVPIGSADQRNPIQATPRDIENAGRVIAMYRREHEPMVLRLFPDLEHRVEYWDIQDIDETLPMRTLARCQAQVEGLLEELRQESVRA